MAALPVVALACIALSGCAINFGSQSASSTPKVSKEDLQKDISQRLANAGQAPQSVSCPSDLVGQLGQSTRCDVTMSATNSFEPIVTVTGVEGSKVNYGAVAYCDVTAAGVTTRRTAEVTQVSGLSMRYGLVPVLAKAVVEGSLLFQLKPFGQQPDSASCAGDLEGKLGNMIECTAVTGGQTQAYILTVTAVQGDNITYKKAPKP